MKENPRRRLTDRDPSLAFSFIDAQTSFTGKMSCIGDIVVAGSVNGEVRANGCFTLCSKGRLEGSVEAADAVIAGQIEGMVTVAGKAEVRRSARICGSLRAGTIAVAEGAIIDGEVSSTRDLSVVRFAERRKEDRTEVMKQRGK